MLHIFQSEILYGLARSVQENSQYTVILYYNIMITLSLHIA